MKKVYVGIIEKYDEDEFPEFTEIIKVFGSEDGAKNWINQVRNAWTSGTSKYYSDAMTLDGESWVNGKFYSITYHNHDDEYVRREYHYCESDLEE